MRRKSTLCVDPLERKNSRELYTADEVAVFKLLFGALTGQTGERNLRSPVPAVHRCIASLGQDEQIGVQQYFCEPVQGQGNTVTNCPHAYAKHHCRFFLRVVLQHDPA